MKILYFFPYLWVIFALLDLGSQSKCGSGLGFSKIFYPDSINPNESGSETRVVEPDFHGSALI
jgi:hypothetical protein